MFVCLCDVRGGGVGVKSLLTCHLSIISSPSLTSSSATVGHPSMYNLHYSIQSLITHKKTNSNLFQPTRDKGEEARGVDNRGD